MGLFRRLAEWFRPVVEEYHDPAFGSLRREGGGPWMGRVPFRHGPTGAQSLQLLIYTTGSPPTEAQRALFREILERFDALWPGIAAAVATLHSDYKTAEAVAAHANPPIIDLKPVMEGRPREWSVDLTFRPYEGDMGYCVEFREWDIKDMWSGD